MTKVPSYVVTGAKGTGKTTVIEELRKLMPEYVVFDCDDVINFMKDDIGNSTNTNCRIFGFASHEISMKAAEKPSFAESFGRRISKDASTSNILSTFTT